MSLFLQEPQEPYVKWTQNWLKIENVSFRTILQHIKVMVLSFDEQLTFPKRSGPFLALALSCWKTN